ncbi:sensor domain-containing diguanylate cyclase [Aquincola tertiaricarbonis]|uniref:sensor domain-containing diguanylate cyclase n=1 Tax=Aquincola tertiaricarbonis TaxID=391953 RepID=UPI00061525D7|nr:sensor domain-containing diguanylate cyclase [Aquincola tertiaricarbonis]
MSAAAAAPAPGLEEEFEALTQFLYMAPIGLVQARLDGEILMVNPLCAQLLMPLSPDGELCNLFTALGELAPDLAHRARGFEQPHGVICDAMQLQVRPRDGGRQAAAVLSLTLLKLDAERLMAVLADVTQQVRRDRELRQNEAWIHTLVTGLTDYALMSLDAQGRVRCWNPSVQRVTGHGESAVGQPYSLFYPADTMPPQRLQDRIDDAERTGWSLDEGWRLRADGSRFWGSCLVAPLHPPEEADSAERAYSLIIRDVSDQREASEALRRSVLTDHLTGVANRRAFFDAAEAELQRCKRAPRAMSLVLIDADHFKRINDAHGHAAGDAVLRHLAAGLAASFREIDVVARLGGEEFVVLLPGAGVEAAEGLARRVCRDIAARTVEVEGVDIRYTVSAGVATMDAGVDDVDALVKRADAAMYAAKHSGRNRVVRWHAGLAQHRAAAAQQA